MIISIIKWHSCVYHNRKREKEPELSVWVKSVSSPENHGNALHCTVCEEHMIMITGDWSFQCRTHTCAYSYKTVTEKKRMWFLSLWLSQLTAGRQTFKQCDKYCLEDCVSGKQTGKSAGSSLVCEGQTGQFNGWMTRLQIPQKQWIQIPCWLFVSLVTLDNVLHIPANKIGIIIVPYSEVCCGKESDPYILNQN